MNFTMQGMPPQILGAAAVAALFVFIGLIWKIRNLLNKFRQQRIPILTFGKINIQHPNSHKRTGCAALSFQNIRGGEAVVKQMKLRVVDHGASVKAGQIRATQPLPDVPYKIHLRSDTPSYSLPLPQGKLVRLKKAKPYKLGMLLHSDENHWYRMAVDITWEIKRNTRSITTTSGQFYMEFPAA